MRECKYCGAEMKEKAIYCDDCDRYQQQLPRWLDWLHHPLITILGAVVTATALPGTAWYLGRSYQQSDDEKTTGRAQLERTVTELDRVIEMITQWQPLDQALKSNCSLEHATASKETEACLAEYTARLVQIDAHVAKLSWTISTTLVRETTYQEMQEWKQLWWGSTRSKVKEAFVGLSKPPGANSKLLTCQSDFETSDCARDVNAAMAQFRKETLDLHKAVVVDITRTKLTLLKRARGSDPDITSLITAAEARFKASAYSNVSESAASASGVTPKAGMLEAGAR